MAEGLKSASCIFVLIVLLGLKLSAQVFLPQKDCIYSAANKATRFKITEDSACKQAVTMGLQDIEARQVKYIYYGNSGDLPIQYLTKTIKEKYAIDVSFPGCSVTNYQECYNKTVDFFIYTINSKTVQQMVEEEQFNYWTSTGSRNPAYCGFTIQLEKDLTCFMKSTIGGSLSAKVFIDRKGNVTEVICDTNFTKVNSLTTDFVHAVKKLRYYPALKKNKPVLGIAYIRFTYNPLNKKGCK